jgi:EAL domain-containing protein (putative c-di-GMP-specific phosphodiesterase class I)
LLLPQDFIPIAEDTGMIIPIGEWVLKQAWAECQHWHSAGQPIRVGVNLSSLQFDQSSIGQLLSEVIESASLDACFLDVELTETLAMRQVNDTLEAMGTLKNLGIQLSIDDFGTGYSSLEYLKRFPIDRLKIDRCFVGDITSDPNDAAIVIAIIAMAHCMGLTVIAEGVETAEQLEFLKLHGCDEIQGYLIGKPMPGDSFLKFLQGGSGMPSSVESLFVKEKI